jgi:hypothetical protein
VPQINADQIATAANDIPLAMAGDTHRRSTRGGQRGLCGNGSRRFEAEIGPTCALRQYPLFVIVSMNRPVVASSPKVRRNSPIALDTRSDVAPLGPHTS